MSQLEPRKTLSIHCKSKDGDLGPHQLPHNQIYEWSFRNNIWGTTLFWCNMIWQRSAAQNVSGNFDIYRADSDRRRCGKSGSWKIEESIMFLYNLFNWEI
ncbi:hypothetical protein ACSBR2_009331 [Camellia fascicularis]